MEYARHAGCMPDTTVQRIVACKHESKNDDEKYTPCEKCSPIWEYFALISGEYVPQHWLAVCSLSDEHFQHMLTWSRCSVTEGDLLRCVLMRAWRATLSTTEQEDQKTQDNGTVLEQFEEFLETLADLEPGPHPLYNEPPEEVADGDFDVHAWTSKHVIPFLPHIRVMALDMASIGSLSSLHLFTDETLTALFVHAAAVQEADDDEKTAFDGDISQFQSLPFAVDITHQTVRDSFPDHGKQGDPRQFWVWPCTQSIDCMSLPSGRSYSSRGRTLCAHCMEPREDGVEFVPLPACLPLGQSADDGDDFWTCSGCGSGQFPRIVFSCVNCHQAAPQKTSTDGGTSGSSSGPGDSEGKNDGEGKTMVDVGDAKNPDVWNCGVCTLENALSVSLCVMCRVGRRPSNLGNSGSSNEGNSNNDSNNGGSSMSSELQQEAKDRRYGYPITQSPVGITANNCIQASLLSTRTDMRYTLNVGSFPLLGWATLPHLGVYGQEYHTFMPMALFELGGSVRELRQQLPEDVMRAVLTRTVSEEITGNQPPGAEPQEHMPVRLSHRPGDRDYRNYFHQQFIGDGSGAPSRYSQYGDLNSNSGYGTPSSPRGDSKSGGSSGRDERKTSDNSDDLLISVYVVVHEAPWVQYDNSDNSATSDPTDSKDNWTGMQDSRFSALLRINVVPHPWLFPTARLMRDNRDARCAMGVFHPSPGLVEAKEDLNPALGALWWSDLSPWVVGGEYAPLLYGGDDTGASAESKQQSQSSQSQQQSEEKSEQHQDTQPSQQPSSDKVSHGSTLDTERMHRMRLSLFQTTLKTALRMVALYHLAYLKVNGQSTDQQGGGDKETFDSVFPHATADSQYNFGTVLRFLLRSREFGGVPNGLPERQWKSLKRQSLVLQELAGMLDADSGSDSDSDSDDEKDQTERDAAVYMHFFDPTSTSQQDDVKHVKSWVESPLTRKEQTSIDGWARQVVGLYRFEESVVRERQAFVERTASSTENGNDKRSSESSDKTYTGAASSSGSKSSDQTGSDSSSSSNQLVTSSAPPYLYCDTAGGGLPFGSLGYRSVSIHDVHFSPNNAHFYMARSASEADQFDNGTQLLTAFTSAGKDRSGDYSGEGDSKEADGEGDSKSDSEPEQGGSGPVGPVGVFYFYYVCHFQHRRIVTFHIIPGTREMRQFFDGLATSCFYAEQWYIRVRNAASGVYPEQLTDVANELQRLMGPLMGHVEEYCS